MKYKIFLKEGGAAYTETDDAKAAFELMKVCSNGHAPHTVDLQKIDKALSKIPDQDLNVWTFFMEINDNARRLFLTLLKHKNGIRGEEFSQESGFPAEKLGGVFGGASKIAKNFDLRIQQFVVSQQIVKGSERYRFFKPGKLLLDYAEKLKEAAKGKGIDIEV
jgi:hypothetical protein